MIISAAANTAGASGRISAPWATNCSSLIALPSPAPACTSTSWLRAVSSRTPAGVIATRYSSVFTSVGTPILMLSSLARARPCRPPRTPGGGPHQKRVARRRSSCQLPSPQRQPELDAVARIGEVAPGELLDAANTVAQRVPVAVQRIGRLLPVPVVLDEHVQRAHELLAVLPLALLDRTEHAAAVGVERVVVLQREQELEGAEILVGGDLGRVAVAQA